jgi:3-oxoacyl-[acyl-carrier protein] reductase
MEIAMNLGLEGKVALIAGASRGIGKASAQILGEEGARLMLAARTEPDLADLGAQLPQEEIATIAADFTQPDAAEQVVRHTLDRFGRLDVLVISIGAAQGGLFWEIPDAQWDDAFALKFMGTVRLLRAAAPIMKAQGSGSIVVVVGNSGKQPHPRLIPGSAANAACLAVVSGLAQELAPFGVQVNAVNPGPTRTDRWTTLMNNLAAKSGRTPAQEEADQLALTPMGRINEPEEIARIVAMFASGIAPSLTASAVTIDGAASRGLP